MVIDFEEYCAIMAKQVNPKQKFEELEKVFHDFAKPDTDYIDAKDLRRVFISLGNDISIDDCKLLIEMFEVNSNGKIHFS